MAARRRDDLSCLRGDPPSGTARYCSRRLRRAAIAVVGALLAVNSVAAAAQDTPPALRAAPLPAAIVIDGRLTEPAWESAEAVEDFRQTDPVEGAPPSARTRVQVLADTHAIVIGIVCDEPDPADIVSFSGRRDAVLNSEDH